MPKAPRLVSSILVLSTLSLLAFAACDDGASGQGPGSATPTPPVTPTTDGGSGGGARPDLDAMVRGGDCPAPAAGAGVEHSGDITADETWRAADGVHRVTSGLRILSTVTIEACARIAVDSDKGIQIGGSGKPGKLVAKGTNADGKLQPVVVAAADASKPWGSLVLDVTGTADLAYTVLQGGDAKSTQQNGGGQLRVFGVSDNSTNEAPVVTKSVRADWLLVEGSGGPGVNLLNHSGFTDDSGTLAVRGAVGDALQIEIGAAAALPKDLLFTGNARDVVILEQTRSGMISTTLVKRAVPYELTGALFVNPITDGAPVTLTIEPGVTLRFGDAKSSSGMNIGSSDTREGLIVARGTAADPIRFTSAKATPAAGDWMGLNFRYYPATGSVFENVTFEYAGGDSQTTGFGCGDRDNDAALLIVNKRPADAWVKSSTFRSNAGATAIVLGWVSDDDGPDFKGNNVFEGAQTCQVSRWRKVTPPACPDTGGTPTCL